MSVPIVIFPDIVALSINYLKAQFALRSIDASVLSEVPNPIHDSMVIVSRTGGQRLNLITDNPLITFESWDNSQDGTSKEKAHDLAQLVRAIMFTATATSLNGNAIYRIEDFTGPQWNPDPDNLSTARYVATMSVAVRGLPE